MYSARIRGALLLVVAFAAINVVRSDDLAEINVVIEGVIRRTDAIVDRAQREVIDDLDRTQSLIRQHTLSVRITGDISLVNSRNRATTHALLKRLIGRVARAEREFKVIYGQAIDSIRQQVSFTFLEAIVLSALRRIDAIVNRAIGRINRLALDARLRVLLLTDGSANYLLQLHDRALESGSSSEVAYYQRLANNDVDTTQPRIRQTVTGARDRIVGLVREKENAVRNEARVDVALQNYGSVDVE